MVETPEILGLETPCFSHACDRTRFSPQAVRFCKAGGGLKESPGSLLPGMPQDTGIVRVHNLFRHFPVTSTHRLVDVLEHQCVDRMITCDVFR
ncbi:hypothetical protein H310_15330 [Aphanomyces invadans]|uniref:Uncharacterized protein n=1 Tax=Aphanomyces invadans TaxID=157072 RepID=A0A024T8C5_9STRA|nr:hypothetical protein H310_15330 [Aphanomyces invadans]ETV89831.1 hypothetical protein H310_15330 [Aphanomyces invadans]|eukprot:XP_008881537.1 hypothetical protein H310_15330 [Aphanomyces invadans]